MTIGQRIRFCRQARGLTQTQLALESGIHPVSVRKYETDKMQPLPEQIQRLADTLQVSYFALAGTEAAQLDGSRETDLTSLLLMLVNAGILRVNCPVLPHGDQDIQRTTFDFQSHINSIFQVRVKGTKQKIALSDIELVPQSYITGWNIMNWQNQKTAYEKAIAEAGEHPSEEIKAALEQQKAELEQYELRLQAEDNLLTDDDWTQEDIPASEEPEGCATEGDIPVKIVNGKRYLVPWWIKHPEDWNPTDD